MVNNLVTSGWQWVRLTGANLGVGSHTLIIAYREDGAHLDKVLVTTSSTAISDIGSPGSNCGVAHIVSPGASSENRLNKLKDRLQK